MNSNVKKVIVICALLCVSQVIQSSEPLNKGQYRQDSNQIIQNMDTVNLEEGLEKDLIKDGNNLNTYISKLRDLALLLLTNYDKLHGETFDELYNELYTDLSLYTKIPNKGQQPTQGNLSTLLQDVKKRLNDFIQECITKYINIRGNNNTSKTQNIKDILNIIYRYNNVVDTLSLHPIQTALRDIKDVVMKKKISSIIKSIIKSKFEICNMYELNSVSDNDLHDIVINFKYTNEKSIIREINIVLLDLIDGLFCTFCTLVSHETYKKYLDKYTTLQDMSKTEELDHKYILTVKYYNKDNKSEDYDLGYYLDFKILDNLSLFDYQNINTNNIQERNILLKKIINQMQEYRTIIHNLVNIEQNYEIYEDNISPEYVVKYKQIINEFTKSILLVFEQCETLINNVENKAKKLLEENKILLSKQSQDNTENNEVENIEDNRLEYSKKNISKILDIILSRIIEQNPQE